MDFDEYEYLEKTVENPDIPSPAPAPAVSNGTKPDDKDRTRSTEKRSSSRHLDKSPSRSSSRHRERSPSRHRERSPSRHRERSPSRHRERSPSRHRERSASRQGERSPSRHRERSPSRHRERSSSRHRSDGDRDRHRSGREHRDDRERERERRSRSRSERHREEERRERSRELRERELERRERSRELRERELRDRDRDSRRYKEKKEEAVEPEADPERDQRTVFAFQIALKANERDVYEFFSRAGKVRDVRLIMDRNSRRSKGVGYIEFFDALSVPMAIALSGQPLLGQPVMVKPSEAEKNLVQSTTAVAGVNGLAGPYSGGARRLYVGNLHFNITEEQLRLVFEPFGPVELVQLPRELETGHCKGYGFIQFQRLEDARAALSLNGQLEIAGRSIKVSAVTDQVGMQDVGINAGDLDDDEGGGLSLNAQSRALLMQKLDRTGTVTSVPGAFLSPVVNASVLSPAASVLGVPAAASPLLPTTSLQGLQISSPSVTPTAMQPVDAAGTPSECLLLKNMFDPTLESDPDFDLDIREDVEDECTKYGTIKHIFVDKNTAGHVYLRFDNTSSAMSAQRALQGRWFAGKMIMATFMTPQNYEAKFPSSS